MNGTSGRTPRRGSSFGPGPRCEQLRLHTLLQSCPSLPAIVRPQHTSFHARLHPATHGLLLPSAEPGLHGCHGRSCASLGRWARFRLGWCRMPRCCNPPSHAHLCRRGTDPEGGERSAWKGLCGPSGEPSADVQCDRCLGSEQLWVWSFGQARSTGHGCVQAHACVPAAAGHAGRAVRDGCVGCRAWFHGHAWHGTQCYVLCCCAGRAHGIALATPPAVHECCRNVP